LSKATHFKRQATNSCESVDSNVVSIMFDCDQNTQNLNWVYSYTFRQEFDADFEYFDCLNADEVQIAAQYLDGLGRPLQSVIRRGSPDQQDMVNPIAYDPMGRQLKTYLPFKSSDSDGWYKENALTTQENFYDNHFAGISNAGDFAFSEVLPEQAGMGRPKKQAAPGQPWSIDGTHTVDFQYRNNTATDQVRKVILYQGQMIASANYLPNELVVSLVADENTGTNEGKIIEYTDKTGRVVLKKVKSGYDQSGNERYLETYYVYDEYSNLGFVIPPAAMDTIRDNNDWSSLNDSTFRANWLFSYRYDGRNRMITKRVPGAGEVHMVYDKKDRLILTQDGNQRVDNTEEIGGEISIDGYQGKNYRIVGSGKLEITGPTIIAHDFEAGATVDATPDRWIFTKYDELDRPVLTGFYYDNRSREQLQEIANNITEFTTEHTGSGELLGYSATSFPYNVTAENLLTATYYDDYTFTDISTVQPVSFNNAVTGQLTGARTRILGSSQWLETITFYDDFYRVVKVVTDNHKDGQDQVENKYYSNVSSLVSETTMEHTSSDYTGALNVVETYVYDHMDRLKTHTHQITGGDEVILSNNTYNDLGELVSKQIGNNGQQIAQQIDYAYNIRGWLTKINDGVSISGSDQFGMELQYEQAGQYNGNIGKMRWKSLGGSNVNEQSYDYTYDPLSRLEGATYQSSDLNGHYDVSNLRYDGNGNILSLDRKKDGVNLDALTYHYNGRGNQLTNVEDSADDEGGFKDFNIASDTVEYEYDANGNMILDKNKGIVSIRYNHLNLPELVVIDDGTVVEYIYDAAGIKLRKEVTTASNVTITDYIAGRHYVNGTLSFLQHGEGRALYNAGSFDYEYNLTDHLGNVRVSIDANGVVVQKDDYYPFGLTFNHYESTPPKNNYTYNGKEEQKEMQWLDFGLRFYDPAVGRFICTDPIAEDFHWVSPYNYAENSPIANIDLWGLQAYY
ncbi:MAG: DUF6443 domain-containing protein, partial [Bacteroidota bacterium]